MCEVVNLRLCVRRMVSSDLKDERINASLAMAAYQIMTLFGRDPPILDLQKKFHFMKCKSNA
jgi:hypothetical protein